MDTFWDVFWVLQFADKLLLAAMVTGFLLYAWLKSKTKDTDT